MNAPDFGMDQVIKFEYVNHRGVNQTRKCVPIEFRWKKVEPYYPEFTWLLKCWDLDRESFRDFALIKMKDIRG